MTISVASSAAVPPRLLICFSHLRWDFVHQRPQHLLTRAARDYRVVYFEEPVIEAVDAPELRRRTIRQAWTIATPVLPGEAGDERHPHPPRRAARRTAPYRVDCLVLHADGARLQRPSGAWTSASTIAWTSSRRFRTRLPGSAPTRTRLFERADLVFTGGYSLYEVKRRRHPNVFAFPSSVDAAHFRQARAGRPDPADQRDIPQPRIGFFGVIDERMDLDLVAHAAAEMPEAQFVMLGPVAKIDPASLPRAANLHWLGGKSYGELPDYLANWSAGWMPFALNAATRFISPTKTPEFLAAGLPLVSTAVPDVVRGYAGNGLVAIADRASIVRDAARVAAAGRDLPGSPGSTAISRRSPGT